MKENNDIKKEDNKILLLRNEIVKKLENVYDPEFPMDVITLGLIRNIDIDNKNNVKITMTLTTPQCPYAPMFIEQIKNEINSITKVNEVSIDLTFDPPWTPDMIK